MTDDEPEITRDELIEQLKLREVQMAGTSIHGFIRILRKWVEAVAAMEATGKVSQVAIKSFEVTDDAINTVVQVLNGFQDTLSDLTFATGELAVELVKLKKIV